MTPRLYRYFQALALLALGLFLLEKLLSGSLVWYIHQRFWPLTALGIVGLLALSQAVLQMARRTPADPAPARSGWGLLIVLLPLIAGWLLPAGPLNADAIGSKGIDSAVPIASGGNINFDVAADERNILDWLRLASENADLTTYLGQPVNIIGFVYHDPRLPEGQFMVSRFAIVCCAADAFAVGLTVQWPEAADLEQDGWVKVKGTMQTTQLDGETQFLIAAKSVEAAELPDQPYLFP